jgi:hypothetical protein
VSGSTGPIASGIAATPAFASFRIDEASQKPFTFFKPLAAQATHGQLPGIKSASRILIDPGDPIDQAPIIHLVVVSENVNIARQLVGKLGPADRRSLPAVQGYRLHPATQLPLPEAALQCLLNIIRNLISENSRFFIQ